MIVRIASVRIAGGGYIDCRKCNVRVLFADPGTHRALIYNLSSRQVIISANTLNVVHHCGRLFEWRCPQCGDVTEHPFHPLSVRRRNPTLGLIRDCRECWTPYEQVAVD